MMLLFKIIFYKTIRMVPEKQIINKPYIQSGKVRAGACIASGQEINLVTDFSPP
jgi:hypothetical protein